jgi:hypothetical protein
VTRADDAFDGVCDGDCSLRDAIAEANRYPGPAVIVANPTTYRLTIPPTAEPSAPGDEAGSSHGDLDVTGDVTFTVKSTDRGARAEIVGRHDDRVLDIHPGAHAILRGWTMSGGRTAEAGAGIRNRGRLVLHRVSVNDNLSEGDGGGISNEASLALYYVDLRGNRAEGAGGGIFNGEGGVLLGWRLDLRANSAATGGATHNRGTTLHTFSELSNNFGDDGTHMSSTTTAVALDEL